MAGKHDPRLARRCRSRRKHRRTIKSPHRLPGNKGDAREHIVACLACTLRNLAERKAAALLLKEVHGFSVDEAAEVLDATPGQVKSWLQEARRYMLERYGATCALIAKSGVCYQCVELDGFFEARQGNPLAADNSGIEARIAIATDLKGRPWGAWHRMVFRLLDDMTSERPARDP